METGRVRTAEVWLWEEYQTYEIYINIELTGVCHGKAAPRVHHVHLWYQFRNIIVLRERETEHVVFMGVGWKQTSCRDYKKSNSGKITTEWEY